MKEKLLNYVKGYIHWDDMPILSLDYDVDLYLADTLPEAWLLARPYDKQKFDDERFYDLVNSANGKWLEPIRENEKYSIILATKNNTFENLLMTFAHELQHCVDYISSVEKYGENRGNMYCRSFADWSEFRAEYTRTRFYAYLNENMLKNEETAFDILSKFLGMKTTDALAGIMCSKSVKDKMYYFSRYMGCQRAVRNLSKKYCPTPVFHLWHLTPNYLTEKYGFDYFYLENTWETMNVHDLYQDDVQHLELEARIKSVE